MRTIWKKTQTWGSLSPYLRQRPRCVGVPHLQASPPLPLSNSFPGRPLSSTTRRRYQLNSQKYFSGLTPLANISLDSRRAFNIFLGERKNWVCYHFRLCSIQSLGISFILFVHTCGCTGQACLHLIWGSHPFLRFGLVWFENKDGMAQLWNLMRTSAI